MKGFGLLEVLISLLIVSVSILGLQSLQDQALMATVYAIQNVC